MTHAERGGPEGPLGDIRVLDLATPAAEATGRVLADLGAEVIKIEPPGGCAARFTPPFEAAPAPAQSGAGGGEAERSLFWRAFGLGKRSVVLDIAVEADRARLRELARSADVWIESFAPGTLDAIGLGDADLRALNPALIYTQVTPFGQTGPEAGSPATDLTLAAAGGLMNFQGDADRPPLPVGAPESSMHGAVQAAADTILALYGRGQTGRGQRLDCAMQAAVVWTLLFQTGFPSLLGSDMPGFGADRANGPAQLLPGLDLPQHAACKDGHVVMTLLLGEVGQRSLRGMMQWAADAGALDSDLAELDWGDFLGAVGAGKITPADVVRGLKQFTDFLATQTKAEIQRRALEGKWLIGPAWNAVDLLADPQLRARNYWVEVAGAPHPGPFARLSRTPIRYRAPAPRLGEHQSLLDEQRPAPRAAPQTQRAASPPAQRTALPPVHSASAAPGALLEGLKVADFSWVAAGPLISKDLANLGACVLHVESENHLDPLRLVPPWKDGAPNVNANHASPNFNQSKLGLAVDLQTPGGREIALRMVDWADVVVESFTPGSAAKLGLDYPALRQRRPDLIMLSSCMRGQTGPEAHYTGFGLQGAGLAGLVAITGWPDRLPSGPWGAYTDFIAPRFSLAALGAALHHRARTGEGQYIDVSQIEAAIHFIEPLLLDCALNGRVAGRAGHGSQRACPHGVFAAQGEERYIAIAAETPAQWRALCQTVPQLPAQDSLNALSARLARKAELEAPLRKWCTAQEPFAAARLLRRAGVPAYPVLRATDLHEDPQLRARGFFIQLNHPRLGRATFEGATTHFSQTPARPLHAGPTIGQHTFETLRDLLGYTEQQITDLAASGALT
ncbi:MAG: CoA transferase [Deltaproteobacteria bacterium]|nr:CoA transferase [Deltaproteobacteria bacterium]